MLLKVLIMGMLLFLFYQDWRYRAVYWLSFPLLAVLLLIVSLQHSDLGSIVTHTGINLAFTGLQLFLLSIYFSIRQGRFINITRGHLGWGDILFLCCISVYFSPVNYMVFYTSSLLLSALAAVALLLTKKDKSLKIPLAGLQALCMVALLLFQLGEPSFKSGDDSWLLSRWYHEL